MNIEAAVNILKWKVCKSWGNSNMDSLSDNAKKLMEREFDAIDEIIGFVNIKQKEQFNNHELFDKLYVHAFIEFRKKKINPIKELHRLLEQPFDVQVERLTNELNDSEVEGLWDELKLLKKHPATINQVVKDKETDVLEEAIKDKKIVDRLYRNVWKPEMVKEKIENQINDFLNKYYYDKTY